MLQFLLPPPPTPAHRSAYPPRLRVLAGGVSLVWPLASHAARGEPRRALSGPNLARWAHDEELER